MTILSLSFITLETNAKTLSGKTESLSEHKREISRTFTVSDMPRLFIKNEFGNIRIIEGSENVIRIKIVVTGKGENKKQAQEASESVDVKFNQNNNQVSATTSVRKINCENCGRNVDYEITAPANTGYVLDNKFGDIRMNNANGPAKVNVEYGDFYANVLSEINLSIRHGNPIVNKCRKMQLKSGYSKGKFGEIESLTGEVTRASIDLDKGGNVELKSGFSDVEIRHLTESFHAKGFTYGSLTIDKVDERFSEIIVDATFAKVKIALNENHQFKASLYSSFGSIDTGNIVFRDKTPDKKDVFIGTAGKTEAPSAVVTISNSCGSIVLQ
jgi:hypothetical protein